MLAYVQQCDNCEPRRCGGILSSYYISMPINLNLDSRASLGQIVLRWTFREPKAAERSRTWWVWACIIGGALVVYAVATSNFLFALLLILFAVIFVGEAKQSARAIECRLTSTGVMVGKKFWRWSDLGSFWIAYQPPVVTSLYLVPKRVLDPRVTIPLEKTNPLKVREHLGKYVKEDLEREDEPTSETLTRLLKLH